MSEKIYHGPSEGFFEVVDGYVDYAEKIIAERSVPDVRDGLKPVVRRSLYVCHEVDKGYLQKFATLVGRIMELHPHGDQAIYNAVALLTDENGSCNMPYFHAMGNLGKCYSSDSPAAMRYTKGMLNDNINIFFKDSDIMEMKRSEEGEGFEPVVLPATFPVVLVNGSSGIAVGAGTVIPSFNFFDVVNLTIKYIENKKLELDDLIVPDFPTGGVLVCNNEEITKIMLTGSGKIKVRAKVEIEGKDILVKEVPYGKTVQNILNKINSSNIQGIHKAIDITGRGSRALLKITCKTKKVVEMVLMELYRKNILQNTCASNILVTENGVPRILGVHDVIKYWYNWRVSILPKKFENLIKGIQDEKITLSYFIRLISNEEWRDTYVNKITRVSKKEAEEYLHEIFEDIPKSVCDWISGRAISAFNRGGSYQKRYEAVLEEERVHNYNLSHLDEYIINELKELKESKRGQYERKTEISYKDYKFSKISDSSEIEDTSYCVYSLMKNGFLRKSRSFIGTSDVLCEFEAQANSILIGFDNFGRILRVTGKEIPFTPYGDNGVYMPKYFEASFQEDYQVLYLCLLDGSKKMLVYRDGYVGFFDTKEYYGKKNIKIVSKGVCLAVRDQLLHIYEEHEIPDYILLADDTSGKIKLGVVVTSSVSERSKSSRAKVLSGNEINTQYLKGFNNMELVNYISDPNSLVGKLKVFRGEFYGEPSDLVEGDYLEICKDLVVDETQDAV